VGRKCPVQEAPGSRLVESTAYFTKKKCNGGEFQAPFVIAISYLKVTSASHHNFTVIMSVRGGKLKSHKTQA
jgi:hypothetical protein